MLKIIYAVPFLPYLPALPKAYSSTLLFVGKNVMQTCKPPFCSNYYVVFKSVPLPPKFVAIITYLDYIYSLNIFYSFLEFSLYKLI